MTTRWMRQAQAQRDAAVLAVEAGREQRKRGPRSPSRAAPGGGLATAQAQAAAAAGQGSTTAGGRGREQPHVG